jgi:hypothetical protein
MLGDAYLWQYPFLKMAAIGVITKRSVISFLKIIC